MNKERIFQITFTWSIGCLALAMALRVLDIARGEVFLITAVILSAVWTAIALYEIHTSVKISIGTKILWTVGLIFFNTIAGLLYYFSGRKTVTGR